MLLHATVSKDGDKFGACGHPSRRVAQACDAPQDEDRGCGRASLTCATRAGCTLPAVLRPAPNLAGTTSMTTNATGTHPSAEIESTYAWVRLAVALAVGTIGSIGMWSFVVALPYVQ